MANRYFYNNRSASYSKKNIAEIAIKKASDDAKRVIRGDHTAGFLASQWLTTLIALNKDPENIYYRRGKRAYTLYCDTLSKEIEHLAAEKGFSITTDIPAWNFA